MSERDELIDQLRYRPVATTAAQMRKAADLLERDGVRIAELEAEIARLRAENAAWKDASQCGHPDPCTLGPLCPYCEIARLKARAEAAEKDAARYRTWRTLWTNATAHVAAIEVIAEAATEAQLDAAVDAAIAQKEGM